MTIQAIIDILTEFSENVRNCKNKTEKGYIASLEKYETNVMDRLMELRQRIPELVQINYDEELSDSEVDRFIESIRKNNSERAKMAPLLFGAGMYSDISYCDIIQRRYFYTPNLSYLEAFTYIGSDWSWVNIVYEIIAATPINKIHFTFIDLEMTGKSTSLKLDKRFYTNIFNQEQLHKFLKEKQKRVEDYLQTGQSSDSYEFIFILSGLHIMNYFSSLFSKGIECGIYFLIVNETGDDWPTNNRIISEIEQILNSEYEKRHAMSRITPLCLNNKICEAILRYANEEVNKHLEKQDYSITASYMELAKENYKAITSSLDVPVGTSVEKPIYFRQDTISHVHTFIIGQSGTGKSSLLHNIILGATATYAPEDLVLYLLDLKIGGVEFNRYRNLKHVRALLVDNTDIQITVEVLRDLQKLMVTRGIQLRESGAVGIDDYNKKNPQHRMPQVLFIADECHEMFNARAGRNTKIYNEMASIIEKIAKEGRSQGVHLVLATQTLAGAEISSSIISNITDYYIFKCSVADSEKLVRDSSKETSSLVTGQLLYAGMQEREVVSCYYYSDDEKKEILSVSETKTTQHCDNRVCYFSGTQIFPLSISECKAANALLEKNPIVSLGYSISLDHNAIRIPLTQKDAENILILGINDELQVTQTTLGASLSLLMSIKALSSSMPVYIMDFLEMEEGLYSNIKKQLEKEEQVTLATEDTQGSILSELATSIMYNKKREAVLIIIGQERFSALKLNKPLPTDTPDESSLTSFRGSSFKIMNNDAGNTSLKMPRTYKDTLEFILTYGPTNGIHTILQIDSPDKLLFADYISPKMVAKMFNHLVMLRSKDNVAPKLGLDDEIRPERLSSVPERLRAYYYSYLNDSYQLFTPYSKIENFKF